ncbi:DRC1 protein, partial [Sitta europaea]|nr:DRC1 protein [Sitta europaea]
RDLARGSAARFRRVWLANEEEAKARIREALAAGRIIHGQLLGIPWEEPSREFLENVGPLGGRREEEEEAMEVVMELLEGGGSRNSLGFSLGRRVPVSELLEGLGMLTAALPGFWGFFPKGFLVENKLLKPLR